MRKEFASTSTDDGSSSERRALLSEGGGPIVVCATISASWVPGHMRNGLLGFLLLFTALSVGPAARGADFTVRVDARDVRSKRVHTELGIPVKPGALTLVYPQWIPGEHAPTGPLDSLIGLHIRANGADLPWARDPLDLFALHVDVPARVERLEIALESGLTTAGGNFTGAPTSSEQLAVLAWNQFLLLPKGSDADKLSIDATVIGSSTAAPDPPVPSTPSGPAGGGSA